jgi:hypothetical protein
VHGPTAMYPAVTRAMVCADVPGRSAADCARPPVSFDYFSQEPQTPTGTIAGLPTRNLGGNCLGRVHASLITDEFHELRVYVRDSGGFDTRRLGALAPRISACLTQKHPTDSLHRTGQTEIRQRRAISVDAPYRDARSWSNLTRPAHMQGVVRVQPNATFRRSARRVEAPASSFSSCVASRSNRGPRLHRAGWSGLTPTARAE